jgi:hypothetical protein
VTRTRTYTRVANELTHTATVKIGDDGKARVPEDQLHHVLLEAGYTELTETTT